MATFSKPIFVSFDTEESAVEFSTRPPGGLEGFMRASQGDFQASGFTSPHIGYLQQLYATNLPVFADRDRGFIQPPPLVKNGLRGVPRGGGRPLLFAGPNEFARGRFEAPARRFGQQSEDLAIESFFRGVETRAQEGPLVLSAWNITHDLAAIESKTYQYPSLAHRRGQFAKWYEAKGNISFKSGEDYLAEAALKYARTDAEFARDYLRGRHSVASLRYLPGHKLEDVTQAMGGAEGLFGSASQAHFADFDAKMAEKLVTRFQGFTEQGLDLVKGEHPGVTFRRLYAAAREVSAPKKVVEKAIVAAPRRLLRYNLHALLAGGAGVAAVAGLATWMAHGKRQDRQSQITGLSDAGLSAGERHSRTQFGSGYVGLDAPLPVDAPQPSGAYSYATRGLLAAAAVAATHQLHKYQLRNSPGYARKLYDLAVQFEELSPAHMGRTFGISEHLSQHLMPETVKIQAAQLWHSSGRTDLGEYIARMMISSQGTAEELEYFHGQSLVFERSKDAASGWMHLVADPHIELKFLKSGRGTQAAAQIGASLDPIRAKLDTTGGVQDWFGWERLKKNFQAVQHSQFPKGLGESAFKPVGELPGHVLATGLDFNILPYMSRYVDPAEDVYSFLVKQSTGFSLARRAHTVGMELMNRPLRLLASIGLGLPQGSYNKLAHIPFAAGELGRGGAINQLLTKRILPLYAGWTALKWLDYHTGHVASNLMASIPLRSNVLRSDLTDMVPGGRSVTDFYENITPGSQYGPLALPAAGIVAGGMAHYWDVLHHKYPATAIGDDARKAATRLLPRAEDIVPDLLKLHRPRDAKAAWSKLWHNVGKPGKGLLIGLAAMLPFVPGMLGSRKTGAELRDIYSGVEPVPVRSGRWWDLGSTPLEGARIKEWRPHWYQLFRSRAEIKSVYGSEGEYWSHHPLVHPLRWLRDPYWLESKHYQDRPYPMTSPALSNVPLIGPLLAATIGKVLKPPVRMHEAEWSGDNYSLYSTRLEPRHDLGYHEPKPQAEFGLFSALKQEKDQFLEFVGLPGFMISSLSDRLFPDDPGRKVEFQGSRQMTNFSRRYYEMELGAVSGPSPTAQERGLWGYSEPFRRFVQREDNVMRANELRNQMPDWMPGDDYFVNFRVGDPYTRVSSGYARLPGAGYEALHPAMEGVKAEDYPDIERFRILADVAPYSKEFAIYRGRMQRQARGNPDVELEYEKVMERVRQMKDSVVRTEERRFGQDTEDISGTIAQASPEGIELEEYPGRRFSLSSLGYSAADLSALALGENNQMNRSQLLEDIGQRRGRLWEYFQDRLSPGTRVKGVVPKGSLATEHIRAVLEANGENINQELLREGLGRYRKDQGGAEASAVHGRFASLLGRYAESTSYVSSAGLLNPLRWLSTPGHTKLWQERDALDQYHESEVVGTRMRRWHRPIHDFLAPYARGMFHRATGQDIITEEVQSKRRLNSMVDILDYLRAQVRSSQDPEHRGRYTNQASRTSIGANLFSQPAFLASTLSDREAHYFRRFLPETDPEQRHRILDLVSPEMSRALSTQWVQQEARVARAEGRQVPELGEQGRLYSEEDKEAYQRAKTRLGYGDWLRSREIADFFSGSGYRLPDPDSPLWSDAFDYEDVKLKMIQEEGYDMHDFNVFDDRASLLWRKPWLQGAVQELTAGDSRSTDNLQRAVESIMLAAGDRDPDVRTSRVAARAAGAEVRVDMEVDDDSATLRDMRRRPERYD